MEFALLLPLPCPCRAGISFGMMGQRFHPPAANEAVRERWQGAARQGMWGIVGDSAPAAGEAGLGTRRLIACSIRSPAITFSKARFTIQMSRLGIYTPFLFALNIWAHPHPALRDPALPCCGNSWARMVGNYGVYEKMGA